VAAPGAFSWNSELPSGHNPFWIRDDALAELGLQPGDAVSVDTRADPHEGDLVVAEVEIDGDSLRLARRYFSSGEAIRLDGGVAQDRLLLPRASVMIMGVIRGRIRFSADGSQVFEEELAPVRLQLSTMSTGEGADGKRDARDDKDDREHRGERIGVGGGDDAVTRIQLAARWAEAYGRGPDSLGSILKRFRAAYEYLDAVTHGVEPADLDRELMETRAVVPPPAGPTTPPPTPAPQYGQAPEPTLPTAPQPEPRPWG
jgi:hypothetical protein